MIAGDAYGVLRLDSALRWARLDECGAEPSVWLPPSLKLRRTSEMRYVGWGVLRLVWVALCWVGYVLWRGWDDRAGAGSLIDDC
jgi:hypothetical protein